MRARSAAATALVALAFAPAAQAAIAFRTVDVVVTSDAPLAAWQVEVRYDRARVKVLSIEGGDGSWREPAYYDGRGMKAGRIVLAAFVDDDARATTGRARVARLHIQIELPEGADAAEVIGAMKVRLVAAAEAGGGRIAPKVELVDPKLMKTKPRADAEREDEL